MPTMFKKKETPLVILQSRKRSHRRQKNNNDHRWYSFPQKKKECKCLVAVSASGRNFALKEMPGDISCHGSVCLLCFSMWGLGLCALLLSRVPCLVLSGCPGLEACGAGFLLLGVFALALFLCSCSGVPCPSSRGGLSRRPLVAWRLLSVLLWRGFFNSCWVVASAPNRVRFPFCPVVPWRICSIWRFDVSVVWLCFFPLWGLFLCDQPSDLTASSSRMSAYFHPWQRSF